MILSRELHFVSSELTFPHLIMPDEAHFELSGCVNKQNTRYWSEANPNELHLQPLHSHRVTVLFGISAFGIIGPFGGGGAVTVTSVRYVHTNFCCQCNVVVTSILLLYGLNNMEHQNILIGSR
jgi:hypothetical protein